MKAELPRMTWLLAVALGVSSAVPAHADPITMTYTGASGSGTLDGSPFTNLAFTITGLGNTTNRQTFTGGGGFWIEHDSASITIDTLGTFAFVTPTRTFFNDDVDVVGFSRGGEFGLDLYSSFEFPLLDGWNLLTSIGPAAGDFDLLQWGDEPVDTSGGVLDFLNTTTSGSFQATVTAVPEPATLALLGGTGLMLVGRRMLRRRQPVEPIVAPED